MWWPSRSEKRKRRGNSAALIGQYTPNRVLQEMSSCWWYWCWDEASRRWRMELSGETCLFLSVCLFPLFLTVSSVLTGSQWGFELLIRIIHHVDNKMWCLSNCHVQYIAQPAIMLRNALLCIVWFPHCGDCGTPKPYVPFWFEYWSVFQTNSCNILMVVFCLVPWDYDMLKKSKCTFLIWHKGLTLFFTQLHPYWSCLSTNTLLLNIK